MDSWTLIGSAGAELDNAATQAEIAQEARESDTSSLAMSTTSLEMVEAEAEETTAEAGGGEGAEAHTDEDAEGDVMEEGISEEEEVEEEEEESEFAHVSEDSELESGVFGQLRQGHYVIDQEKLHRLFDALSHSSQASSEGSPSQQRPAPTPAQANNGEGVDYSEELPVNWVQRYSTRLSNYIHRGNDGLNWKLSLLLTLASAMVVGLGIGHFMGSTHSWLRRHRAAKAQVEQLRSLQDSLLGCLRRAETAETAAVGLQRRLAACQDVAYHCSPDERPQQHLQPLHSLLTASQRREGRMERRLRAIQASARAANRRAAALHEELRRLRKAASTATPPSPPQPQPCPPPPSAGERARQAQHWLNLSNLTALLDSYLEALGEVSLGNLGEDSIRIARTQLTELGTAVDGLRHALGAEVAAHSEDIRHRLETALSRVWDTATTAAANFDPPDFANLRTDLGDHLRSLIRQSLEPPPSPDYDSPSREEGADAAESPSTSEAPFPTRASPDFPSAFSQAPDYESPTLRPCPQLPPAQDIPQHQMRQLRGALKRSSLWDEIGREATRAYLSDLKGLYKSWPLDEEGLAWWESQRRWWLGCDEEDGDEDFQQSGHFHRQAFIAKNPGVEDLLNSWLAVAETRRSSDVGEGRGRRDWEMERGRGRARIRQEEAAGDWLWERGQRRKERRREDDLNYAANEWSFRRGRGRDERRAKGDFPRHIRPPHSFRSFA